MGAGLPGVVKALLGEAPIFKAGDRIRVCDRFPIGHYRVPTFIRAKFGVIETVIEPPELNNEEEGFGRNAGSKRHYYRITIPLTELWPNYAGPRPSALTGIGFFVFLCAPIRG